MALLDELQTIKEKLNSSEELTPSARVSVLMALLNQKYSTPVTVEDKQEVEKDKSIIKLWKKKLGIAKFKELFTPKSWSEVLSRNQTTL